MINIKAPGRICLFGEHQDYLGYPTLSMAISKYINLKANRILQYFSLTIARRCVRIHALFLGDKMKTYMAKEEDIKRKWHIIDAKGKILGRLASRIAIVLRGKHKAEYTPHIDSGDEVIVINADKIRTTGKKFKQKKYDRYFE